MLSPPIVRKTITPTFCPSAVACRYLAWYVPSLYWYVPLSVDDAAVRVLVAHFFLNSGSFSIRTASRATMMPFPGFSPNCTEICG
jgi:hypothetical protein